MLSLKEIRYAFGLNVFWFIMQWRINLISNIRFKCQLFHTLKLLFLKLLLPFKVPQAIFIIEIYTFRKSFAYYLWISRYLRCKSAANKFTFFFHSFLELVLHFSSLHFNLMLWMKFSEYLAFSSTFFFGFSTD